MEDQPQEPNQQSAIEAARTAGQSAYNEALAEARNAVRNGIATEQQRALIFADDNAPTETIETDDGPQLNNEHLLNDNPLNTDPMNVLNTRIERQQGDIARNEWFGEVDTTAQKQELQGDVDMRDYLNTRDYQDADGNIHDAQTDEIKPIQDANNKPEDLGLPYEDAAIDELITKWATAEDNFDETTSTNLQNQLQERLLRADGISPDHLSSLIDLMHKKMMDRRKYPSDDTSNEGETDNEEASTDNQDDTTDEEKLSLTAARGKGTLQELVHRAMEIVDSEQHDLAAAKGIRGILKKIVSGFKYSAALKLETQRKRSEEMLFAAQAKTQESGRDNLTLEEWREVLNGEGVTFTSAQEMAFLSSINEQLFAENEGVAFHSEGADEAPEMTTLRTGIKEKVLAFIGATGSEGLTDEQREVLFKQHQDNISKIIDSYMESNPTFVKEELNVYVDNARQLLERSLATMRHDDGLDRLDKMLDSMRIDIGQRQLGAYNNLNTEYIEKTIKLAKNHNLGSAISKATFVVGTWITAGALSSGLFTQTMRSVPNAGAKTAGAVVGGVLGGPVGLGIGLAASVGVSAAWGRHMARRRTSDNADMAATSVAYAGSREEANTFVQLSPDVLSYNDATSSLREFLELKPDVNPETAEADDWQIRSGLSNEELIKLTSEVAIVQAKLDKESEFNTNAASIAAAERGQNMFKRNFRSQADQNGRALNLFQASDNNSYIAEKSDMLMSLRTLTNGIEAQYSEAILEFKEPAAEGTEAAEPIKVPLNKFLGAEWAEQTVANEILLTDYQNKVQAKIKKAGHKGAANGALIGAAAGVGGAVVGETLTHGSANTIFDIFKGHNQAEINETLLATTRAGETIKAPTSVIAVDQYVGKSNIEIVDNQATFTNYSGEPVVVNLGNEGQISPADVAILSEKGIEVTQATNLGSNGQATVEQYAAQLGAHKYKVTDWANNFTNRSDSTELGAQISSNDNSNIVLEQASGIAKSDGINIDIAEAAKQGKIYARIDLGDGTAITVPGELGDDGVVRAVIDKDSQLSSLFTTDGNNVKTVADSWGWSYGNPDSSTGISISTIDGLDQNTITYNTPASTTINVNYITPEATAEANGAPIFTVGATFGRTEHVLGNRKTNEQIDAEKAAQTAAAEGANEVQPTNESAPTSGNETTPENIDTTSSEDNHDDQPPAVSEPNSGTPTVPSDNSAPPNEESENTEQSPASEPTQEPAPSPSEEVVTPPTAIGPETEEPVNPTTAEHESTQQTVEPPVSEMPPDTLSPEQTVQSSYTNLSITPEYKASLSLSGLSPRTERPRNIDTTDFSMPTEEEITPISAESGTALTLGKQYRVANIPGLPGQPKPGTTINILSGPIDGEYLIQTPPDIRHERISQETMERLFADGSLTPIK